MEGGDLLVKLLGEDVDLADFVFVIILVLPELDLGEDLVGEGAGHDERGVTGGASEVHKSSTGKNNNTVTIWEEEAINLILDWLDDHAWVVLNSSHVDLVVEVTNVADDGIVLHLGHIGGHDDAEVSGGSDENIGGRDDGCKSLDFISFHAGLKGADGVDFADDDAGTACLHGGGATLADITVAVDDDLLASDHDISSAHESVREGVAATVNVVELGLGDAVIDVDGLAEKSASLGHLFQSVDTSGGLLGDTVEACHHLAPLLGVASFELAAEDAEDFLHLKVLGGCGVGECSEFLELLLGLDTLVDDKGGITTVIDEHIGTIGIGPREHGDGAFPVLVQGLTLPGEDVGGLGLDDGGGSVVLGRVDVASGPSDLGTKGMKGLDEDTGLDGHMEGTRDAGTVKGSLVLLVVTDGHKAGHLDFSEVVLTATEVGEGHVLDFRLEAVRVDTVCSVNHCVIRLCFIFKARLRL